MLFTLTYLTLCYFSFYIITRFGILEFKRETCVACCTRTYIQHDGLDLGDDSSCLASLHLSICNIIPFIVAIVHPFASFASLFVVVFIREPVSNIYTRPQFFNRSFNIKFQFKRNGYNVQLHIGALISMGLLL